MIRRLRGPIIEKNVSSVVIDIGGVGYHVAVPVPAAIGYEEGATVSLYTYLAVRENALDLYGFSTRGELDMFELLIELPKIGPKTALQIMSQADASLIRTSVQKDDPAYLHKMSGIGKKTAEKIVLGLKDVFLGDDGGTSGTHSMDSDVVDALTTLGYSQKEARDAVQKVSTDATDTNARIKEALKLLAKQ